MVSKIFEAFTELLKTKDTDSPRLTIARLNGFSTLQLCEHSTHSVETELQILLFHLFPG